MNRAASASKVPPPNLSPTLHEALARLGGHWDVLAIVCKMFIDRCPIDRAALLGAYQQGDAEGVARSAHRLRGALGQVNTGRAFELCAIIEERAVADDLPTVGVVLPELEIALTGLTSELEAAISHPRGRR